MTQDQNSGSTGQSGIDQETERRNSENETGEQSQQPQSGQSQQAPQSGQSQQAPQAGQSQQQPQSGQSQQAPQWGQSQQAETGQQSQQSDTMKTPTDNFAADKQGSEGGSGFVGSSDDTSSDYLTKGENQDFAPEGQGASNAGDSDIETGPSSNIDSTLDDGSNTSE